MTPSKTLRDPLDFYPTPSLVTGVLASWLEGRVGAPRTTGRFLDPAAGDGALIAAFRTSERWREAHWSAIELDPARADACETVAEDVTVGDALNVDWTAGAAVMANPPFRLLDGFWLRALQHRAEHHVWVAMLTPVAWWNAEKRSAYRKPDHLLALGWRPTFRLQNGPAHKGSQDFAWAVLEPIPLSFTTWHHMPKPKEVAP